MPENYDAVRSGLAILVGIPYARRIEIGDNLHFDHWSKEISLVVYGEFDSQQSLDAFKKHPLYLDSISKVKDLRELRFAADYCTNKAIVSSGR
ncbi:hypothetical protein lam_039 [Candidatus Liberibacter americanus str. Sao Paulo]|uniref:Stress-response A/B barrel domain-containing protein n=1 Tax=Candidatus Liberibacter americanus str. Sao Paulo TaxID=1261131 RepID=U6B459_9HYPH|nr:hypothetical protein lam_039 [Candidatus Liberibacter americanus str. Sao Paulo]EMS36696.1 hypothetical protein G653_00575 [Candidatus Liberibacter americanus PW_SP]